MKIIVLIIILYIITYLASKNPYLIIKKKSKGTQLDMEPIFMLMQLLLLKKANSVY